MTEVRFCYPEHNTRLSKISSLLHYLQAIERLNFKAKHFKDLINDEPFTRADVIPIQVI